MIKENREKYYHEIKAFLDRKKAVPNEYAEPKWSVSKPIIEEFDWYGNFGIRIMHSTALITIFINTHDLVKYHEGVTTYQVMGEWQRSNNKYGVYEQFAPMTTHHSQEEVIDVLRHYFRLEAKG